MCVLWKSVSGVAAGKRVSAREESVASLLKQRCHSAGAGAVPQSKAAAGGA